MGRWTVESPGGDAWVVELSDVSADISVAEGWDAWDHALAGAPGMEVVVAGGAFVSAARRWLRLRSRRARSDRPVWLAVASRVVEPPRAVEWLLDDRIAVRGITKAIAAGTPPDQIQIAG